MYTNEYGHVLVRDDLKLANDDGKVSKGSPLVTDLIPSNKISFPPDANLAVSGEKSLMCIKKEKNMAMYKIPIVSLNITS